MRLEEIQEKKKSILSGLQSEYEESFNIIFDEQVINATNKGSVTLAA